jgi:hypothetical protein
MSDEVPDFDDGFEPFRKDFLTDEFHRHPLAADIIRLAAENEVDLTDVSAVSKVLGNLRGSENTDPKVILILSLILECLIHHKEMLSLKELMDSQSDDNDNQE